MRVCHAIANIDPTKGGPSNALATMVEALDLWDVDLQVALTDHGRSGSDARGWHDLYQRVVQHASEVRVSHAWDARWYTAPRMVGDLRSLIARADVVHIHSLYLFHTLAASRIAFGSGVPYVLRPHGTLTRHDRARSRGRKALYRVVAENRTLHRCALIHCTSERERREVLEVLPQARTAVVPLPVHATVLPRAVKHKDELEVLFLGRLTPKKRPEMVLQASALLAAQGAAIHVSLAGPVDPRSSAIVTEEAEAARAAGARVDLLGPVSGETKWQLYARAHVFVLPSTEENFGISVVEAMMCGVPTIATEGVAIANDLSQAGALELIEPSAADLAARLRALWEDQDRALTVAETGQRVANARFSPSSVGGQLVSLYETVLS